MIPTIWQIIEDCASGALARRDAYILIKAHIKLALFKAKQKRRENDRRH